MTALEAARWISLPAGWRTARVRLLCLPHAGSGAAAFVRWRRLLPESIAVCPVTLPGRETRMAEASLTSLEEIVDRVHEAVRVLAVGEPLAVFGHSMGSLLAYEVALRLTANGTPLRHLFVSGRGAPGANDGRPDLHHLEDEPLLAGLRKRYGLTADGLLDDADLRAVFLPILRADLTVVETYRAEVGRMLSCPVHALAGEQDASVAEEGLRRWGALTSGKFVAGRMAGDHFYHTGAGQRALLELLERTFGDAEEITSSLSC